MTPTAPVIGTTLAVGVIDPAWAPVANTFLIILLAVFQGREAAKVRAAHNRAKAAEEQARDAKRAAGAVRRESHGWGSHADTGQRRRWSD